MLLAMTTQEACTYTARLEELTAASYHTAEYSIQLHRPVYLLSSECLLKYRDIHVQHFRERRKEKKGE